MQKLFYLIKFCFNYKEKFWAKCHINKKLMVGQELSLNILKNSRTTKTKIKIKNNSKDFISVIIFSFIFLSFISTDIILSVLHISLPFLLIFLFIVLHIGMLSLLLYFLTKTFFKIKYGNLKYVSKAKIIDEIDNFEE